MPKAKYDEAENKIETIELERLESKATRVWLLLPELPGCIKNGRSCQKCKLFFSLKQWLICIHCIHRLKHYTMRIIVSISVVDNLPHWYLVKIAKRRPESNNSYKVQIQNTEELPGAKICLCQWHF